MGFEVEGRDTQLESFWRRELKAGSLLDKCSKCKDKRVLFVADVSLL